MTNLINKIKKDVNKYFENEKVKDLMKAVWFTPRPNEIDRRWTRNQRVARRELIFLAHEHIDRCLEDRAKNRQTRHRKKENKYYVEQIHRRLSAEIIRRGEIIRRKFLENGSDREFEEIYQSLLESYLSEDIDEDDDE